MPGNVNPSVAPDGELTAADRSSREDARGLAVHANGRRERRLAWCPSHVIKIAARRVAGEINQVQRAGAIDDGLRLDSSPRRLDNDDPWYRDAGRDGSRGEEPED